MSILSQLAAAPPDPILGKTEAFRADPRPEKVNLGVGVYQNSDGRVPLMRAVRRAEEAIVARAEPRSYLPIDGLPAYRNAVKALVAGEDERAFTVQTLGGTGALRVGADLVRLANPRTRAWVSTPTWENHPAVFSRSGIEVREYRYLAGDGVDAEAAAADLAEAAPGDIVVLHACCHNPTGYDPTPEQWDRLVSLIVDRGLLPFVDMAYQGFDVGLDADRGVVERFARAGVEFLVANSFSKSFSLYSERVGGLTVVCESAEAAARVGSRCKTVVRSNYSNPPRHGASLVAEVLGDPGLRADWADELESMRLRIKSMRAELAARLIAAGCEDAGFVTRQNGMFSYSGLSKEQMGELRERHAIYGLDSGRICVAALNDRNIERVAEAIASVWRK